MKLFRWVEWLAGPVARKRIRELTDALNLAQIEVLSLRSELAVSRQEAKEAIERNEIYKRLLVVGGSLVGVSTVPIGDAPHPNIFSGR